MSFLDRFRRPRASDAPAAVSRERFFSTHFEMGVPKAAAVSAVIDARLKAAAPKAPEGVTSAMDGMDLSNCTDLTGVSAPNISETLFAWYGLQTFIGHQLAAIVAQHWLIAKACAMPARDAVRHGFDLTVNDQEDDDKAAEIRDAITAANKRYGLNKKMVEFVRKGRVFGVRIVIFTVETDNPDDYYKNPFNIDAVKPGSYKGPVQVDPYWAMPQFEAHAIRDPASPDFYEPTWWRIGGRDYHKSHLHIFRTEDPPDILKPQYQYGGVPIPQKIMERVYAAERTANEAPQLAMSKRLTVWNTDVEHLLANQDKFLEHMANFNNWRDNFGVKVIDEADQMQQFDTTLTGLNELISTQYEIVAAAANVPVSKLLGTTPKGFNSTGDYEESSYHEELETIQENDLTPFVDRHHQLVAKSELEEDFGDVSVHIEWRPVDSPDAKEYAEINYAKAQTDDLLVGAGAIDAEDVRNRIRKDRDSGYTGISADVPEPVIEEPPLKPNPSKALNLSAKAGSVA